MPSRSRIGQRRPQPSEEASELRAKLGGRPRGVPNKASVRREREVRASGQTPLDYLLEVMRNVDNEEEVRVDAAKAAAPYVHPKLSAVAVRMTPARDYSGLSMEQLKLLDQLLLHVVEMDAQQIAPAIEHEP